MTTKASESEANAGDPGIFESVKSAIDGLGDSADVRRVYGDPITVEGKTLVPVARVAYVIGGGFGSNSTRDAEDSEGGGGGGGMMAHPVGVLEITEEETRFVRFADTKRTAVAVGVGILIGRLLGRR